MSETEESESKFIGRIYQITSPNSENVYVGSTTQTLNQRLQRHISDYNRFFNGNESLKICRSSDVIKYGDPEMHLIYERLFYPKKDLHKLEGETMQSIENCCNTDNGKDKKRIK